MEIRAWRITHKDYKESAFTGEGAKLFGGRFNSEGSPLIYASASLSLAMLEILVQNKDQDYFKNCVVYYADIPQELIFKPDRKKLPEGWDKIPYGTVSQKYGDKWIMSGDKPVLQVPSVVVSIENNYLINPLHYDFQNISFSSCEIVGFDERIHRLGHKKKNDIKSKENTNSKKIYLIKSAKKGFIGHPGQSKLPTLLHVEDSTQIRLLVSILLKNEYKIQSIESGEKAIELAQSKNFDLILMDINLGSGLSGLEAAIKIRNLNEYKDTPIIATSISEYDQIHDELKNARINAYIQKPFDKAYLLENLKKLSD